MAREHRVGFFILADEELTIHRKKFAAFCEELVRRDLGVLWGINTRVTDILRDEVLLPLYRKAGLVHLPLGTEAATTAVGVAVLGGLPTELGPWYEALRRPPWHPPTGFSRRLGP